MLSTLAKIVTQQYHEAFWDRVKQFMQRLHWDQQQPAPTTIQHVFKSAAGLGSSAPPVGKSSAKPPASADTKANRRNDAAMAEVDSGATKVFRSAVDQDKLAQDVLNVFGQYDDQYGFNGQQVLGDWLNSLFKGEFGEELRQLQRIHMQGINAQIAAFDWNVVCAKRLLVAKGQPAFGGLAIGANEWNQVFLAVFTEQMDSYQELTRYHIPALFARCVELSERVSRP